MLCRSRGDGNPALSRHSSVEVSERKLFFKTTENTENTYQCLVKIPHAKQLGCHTHDRQKRLNHLFYTSSARCGNREMAAPLPMHPLDFSTPPHPSTPASSRPQPSMPSPGFTFPRFRSYRKLRYSSTPAPQHIVTLSLCHFVTLSHSNTFPTHDDCIDTC